MKNKIVVWGTNAADEKILIALELQSKASKVMLYTFSEAIATTEFVNKMMNDWREGKAVEFPEGHTSLERELSVTESLLPDDLKVSERGEIIQRAQTEWHFAVLSSKLHEAYQQELAEFKEKVEQLTAYDNKIWDNLKGFWDKVQNQSRERNLFREHANHLRDNINLLFEDLKKMRNKVQGEFMAASSAVADEFNKALDDVEARIAAGGSKLNVVFDELKQMQRKYKDARMSNEHRNQIWNRLDDAFKKAKERKFGPAANDGSLAERHDRRLSGLIDAQKRMEESIKRDEEELDFQKKKVNTSEGQLESQIRMAKIKMIEERVVSKREKMDEMNRTVADIERQANIAKTKEDKRAEKEAEKQKMQEAKEAVKSEIAAEIRTKSGGRPEKEESLYEAAATMLGDVLMDAIDTAKAVASVVAEKAEEAMDVAVEKGADALDKAKAIAGVVADKAEEAMDVAVEKGGEAMDKAKAFAGAVAEKAEEAMDVASEKGSDAFETAKAFAGAVAEKAEVAFESAMDKAEEAMDSFKSKAEPETEATAETTPEAAPEAVAPVVADLESTEKADADGVIIEDVVHKAEEAALESTAVAEADGVIIEDVVHKSEAALEATDAAENTDFIIEDVVHVAEKAEETATPAEDASADTTDETEKKDA